MSSDEDSIEPLDEEEDFFDDVDDGNLRRRLEAFIPDLVRRTLTAGVGAVMTTEEGFRKLGEGIGIPKDVAGYLATTAGATKDPLLRIFAREIREFLQTVNLSEEIARMLTLLSFEVKTEIRFIPNDQKLGGVQPDVRAKVKLKRVDEKGRRARPKRRRRKPPEPPEESEPADSGSEDSPEDVDE